MKKAIVVKDDVSDGIFANICAIDSGRKSQQCRLLSVDLFVHLFSLFVYLSFLYFCVFDLQKRETQRVAAGVSFLVSAKSNLGEALTNKKDKKKTKKAKSSILTSNTKVYKSIL